MKNFEEKLYKFLFRFYNFSGALCLKFDGKRFEISKFHYFKVLITVILFLISFFIVYISKGLNAIRDEAPELTLTKFSDFFLNGAFFIPVFLLLLVIIIQIHINDDIAKMFKIILFCKKTFEINEQKLHSFCIKILKHFLIYKVSIIIYFIIHILATRSTFDARGILKLVLTLFIDLFYTAIFSFVNCLLLHLDFLINYCEESLRKTSKSHSSFNNFIKNRKVQILFILMEIFNQSVSRVLTFCITFLGTAIVVVVSLYFK